MTTVVTPTFLRDKPEDDAARVTQVLPGEQVEPVETQGEWTYAVVPGQPSAADERGYPGWLRTDALVLGRAGQERPYPHVAGTTAAVLAHARGYLGVTYVWGGTATDGIDCSGLTFRSAEAAGITIPRDARDQAPALEEVDLADVRPGDLYFFAGSDHDLARITHVAIATAPVQADGSRPMIHACGQKMRVAEEAMPEDRRATLVSAARLRRPAGVRV